MRKIVFWFLLGVLFTANSVSGYTDDYIFFQNGDNNNGLSSQSVSSIEQDSKGFMWFGTQSGLNRFDGYEFKVYKKQPFNSNSLSNDKIQTLYMDENDVLWIGTYQGLCKFNIKTEIFTRYPYIDGDSTSLSNNVVISILKDSSGRLWVGTADGLNLFNSEKGSFKHYFYNSGDPNSLSNNVIRAVHEDYEGNIWVGTYGGINRYRDKTDDFISYQHDNNNPATIASNNVMVIKQVKERELWLGTWGGGGLSKLDTSTGLSTNYSLPDNRTYSLNMQNEDVIYVGTWGGGLIRYNPKEEGSKQYLHVANKTTSISHNIVYSMFKDKSGVFWIGTHGGGLNKMKETDNDFQFWTNNPNDPFSINSGRIDEVFIDSKGILWIGTYNGGLNRINVGMDDRVIHYTHDPDQPGTISNDIINDISEDSRNNLLIATNSGLNRYDPLSDSFERWFSKDSDIPLPDQIVYALQEDTDGTLWVGTYNGGLMHYDYKKDKADYYANDYADPNSLSDNLVYKIFIDSYNNLWIGTNNGLNLFNRTTGNFIRYIHNENDPYSLTDSCIQTIFEDSNFNLWIGTASGGLNKLDRETGRFSHYMKEDGLPSNKILGILEDHEGLLWISTASNLTVFTPEDEYFQKVDEDDGIFAKEFAHGFSMGDRGENLYIGTTEGLYKISPGGFSINTYIPPVHLTSFRVFDEEVNYGKSLQEVDEFELSYNDKFIAFEFASLDFVNPEKNQYAYKLEGFDKEWIYSGNRRYASYTNLPFGKYTFRVMGSNNDGVWNEEGLSLKVIVTTQFWKSWWFYCMLALPIIIYVIKLQTEINKKRRVEEALRKSEVRFRTIYENAPVLINAFDENGRFVFWNKQCRKTFGWTIDEINAHYDTLALFYPDPAVHDKVMRIISTEPDGRRFTEWHPVTKDGKSLTIMWANFRLPDGMTFNLGYDITARKQTEEALRKSEERLGTILSTMNIGLILHNPDRTVAWVNQWVRQMFQHGDPVGRVCYEFFEGKSSPCDPCAVRDCFETGGEINTVESHNQANNHWYSSIAHPIKDNTNQVTQVLESVMDITEHKRAEEELTKYREHLEKLVEKRTEALQKVNIEYAAANKELKEFAYIVSHDLKAPLRAISQLTHWISEDYSHLFDDDGKKQMDLILQRVKRMYGLIDGILHYSRIGQIREKEEHLDMNLLVNEVIDNIAPPDTVRIIFENKLPVVLKDSTRMEQIFQNLIGNAIKFMDKDEGIIKVGCADEGAFW
ncbi:MAG: PAS domain S-box protein, partial [Cyclobacteriaceae bacterium]|nr:PAS domain S-box protein [Cyclobacteriaceae bacterium]